MRRGDFVWSTAFILISGFLFYPGTRSLIVSTTKTHPYIMGFLKFAILATMGELLAIRIVTKNWGCPTGFVFRIIIWGLIGTGMVIIFGIYGNGVVAILKEGLLPGEAANSSIVTAFWISAINNVSFAPALFLFHKISDTYIDLAKGRLANFGSVTLSQVAEEIDWKGFLNLVIFKTIPFFWIPAHTITFSLPPEYRVLCAAFLSIALGGILGYAKCESREKEELNF